MIRVALIVIGMVSLLFAVDQKLSFTADFKSHANNLEYFNDYREGYLLLGAGTDLYFVYDPHPQFEISVGAHLQKEFGDESYYSDVRPYLRGRYFNGGYSLTIGVLDNENRHGLPDAQLSQQSYYIDGLEEGFQVLFDYDAIYADVWLAVHQLNTPEHRENLNLGAYVKREWGSAFSTSAMLLWDHFGGQQYAPEGDSVRNNTTGSGELAFVYPHADTGNGWGITGRVVASATSKLGKGYGGMIEPWFMINRFRTSVNLFKGEDYHTWRGNTIYLTNDIYYYLQVERKTALLENLVFDWGVRFDFVDITPDHYFDAFEYQLWATFTTKLKLPIWKSSIAKL